MLRLQATARLVEIMARLRSEQGCRWDRQQSPEILKPYILEECYELLEAIDGGDSREICDELGDMLLQVVFQAQIFAERGEFTLEDAATAICEKMVRRHPHIFAAESTQGHAQRWEKIKLQERAERGQSNRLADRLPQTLPALKRATKLSSKLSHQEPGEIFDELLNHLEALRKTLDKAPHPPELQARLAGEILFSLCRLTQSQGIDAEDILRQKTQSLIAQIDAQSEPKESSI